MKRSSILFLFLLALAGCNACNPNANAPQAFPAKQVPVFLSVKQTDPSPSPSPAGSFTLNLSPSEDASLNKALAGSGSLQHIHVGVTDNKELTFTADQAADPAAASHVTGNEMEISVKAGESGKKIVATPQALDLLKKRAAQ